MIVSLRRRVPLRPGPWRRPGRDTRRPPTGVPFPADWADRTWLVWERDLARCRFCGADLPWGFGGSVDHVVPRRLCAPDDGADAMDNLALLCARHHWRKTHGVEPALYRGDPWPFFRFLDALRRTGPVPGPGAVGALDFDGSGFCGQVKHVKRLSLPELARLAQEVERIGFQASPPRIGVVVVKLKAGRGYPTPRLIVLTEAAWRELNGPVKEPD